MNRLLVQPGVHPRFTCIVGVSTCVAKFWKHVDRQQLRTVVSLHGGNKPRGVNGAEAFIRIGLDQEDGF